MLKCYVAGSCSSKCPSKKKLVELASDAVINQITSISKLNTTEMIKQITLQK